MKNITLTSFVLLVADVAKSKDFYVNLLDQEVTLEINNINIGFRSGLALWDRQYASSVIFGTPAEPSAHDKSVEIYFETPVLDQVHQRIIAAGTEIIHDIRTQPWQQRVFRFRDPDGFMVDVGETMAETVKRLKNERMTIEMISEKTMMPGELVEAMLADG